MKRLIRQNRKISDYLSLLSILVGVVLLFISIHLNFSKESSIRTARKVERLTEGRVTKLNAFMAQAVTMDDSDFMDLIIPQDMVVYRYVDDSLRSWNNQFSLINDEIHRHYVVQKLTNPRSELNSALNQVTEQIQYLNFGPKWYLVKSMVQDNVEIIGGLEIVNDSDEEYSGNGTNPKIRLPYRYNVKSLSYSGGEPIYIEGEPVFKVLFDSTQIRTTANVLLVWMAFLLFAAGILVRLHSHRSIRNFFLSMGIILSGLVSMYIWGKMVQDSSQIFSPSLYADGSLLYSLGAVLIFNLAISLLVFCAYLVRFNILRHINTSARLNIYSSVLFLGVVLIVAFTFYAVRSIIVNSTICLELYNLNDLSAYSVLVYVSFMLMLLSVPLLLQMLRPWFRQRLNLNYDVFSTYSRFIFAALCSIILLGITAYSGFDKEKSRQEVWANRLSVDRDINLEMQLRSVEMRMANDQIISQAVVFPNAANVIISRITENYLPRITQEYDLQIAIFDDVNFASELMAFFHIQDGEPVADGSNFIFSTSTGSHASYTGIFSYPTTVRGLVHLLIRIEPKANKENIGYQALLGYSAPGRVILPAKYSYAKYSENALVTSKGKYSYPVTLSEKTINQMDESEKVHMKFNGYAHFVNRISDNEIILISRPVNDIFSFILAFLFLAIIMYFAMCLLTVSKKYKEQLQNEKTYYKSRVSTVVVLSLVITLVVMASVSVVFVYDRNDSNLRSMMVDKVNSIQAFIANDLKGFNSLDELDTEKFRSDLGSIALLANSDITIFSPLGKVFYSTAPEIFDRQMLGSRIDQQSYNAIVHKNRRYFIHAERIGTKKYYVLHAPIYNNEGQVMAITASPYTDDRYDFELDAIKHSVTVLTLFLILVIFARFAVQAIVKKIFNPLSAMGRKMNAADIDNLEHISYDRDDEISALVESYNRMVSDLSESSKQLAQAERDKAWSAMARQVAHEIKNPLTPMKLQIQRLIRLKQKNAPGWQEKFDEVVQVVLDHIDILTDTANEFSTFAKLYTEAPILINLDQLIQEEIMMFDNKDNIEFVYYGLEGAKAMGPKPQLTRVFVNLITNAVQAIEIHQQAEAEEGREATMGKIIIQLRNSVEEGYYDIVFEDNGPGVSDENLKKLFTPNFTTKSSGTGLGLSISRSILDMCKASISYSKSFSLQGACFTIRYPKNADERQA